VTDDFAAAGREALRRAAEYVASFLRHRSPSAEDASAWRIERRGDAVYLRNSDVSAWATEVNARHPLFGNREHWYATNQRDPGRTHWASNAVLEAAGRAEQLFGDTYLERVAAESPYFELGR
jgi:hypothetical protein